MESAHAEDVICMKVEIYSKAECSLCEEAKAVIEAVRRRLPFELVEHDIEADPELYQRFRYDVPVIFIDGRKAFKHRLDPATFEARLRRGEPQG
jgi:glutaredoxin